MAQTAFAHADPAAPTEFGFRVPSYFQIPAWRNGASWAWTGAVALLFLAMCVWGNAATDGAVYPRVLRSAYVTVLPALMAVFLFRQGGIDLSMGSVAGVTAAVCAALAHAEVVEAAALPVALVAGMAVALVFGLVHALLVGFLRLPGFLATIPSLVMGRGLLLAITQGRTLLVPSTESSDSPLATSQLVGWGLVVVLFVAVLLLVQLRSPQPGSAPASWTQQSLALGLPYFVSSLVAGATGLLLMFHIRAATAMHAQGLEQDALFAVILGGAWLAGRWVNVAGALVGALLLAALQANMAVFNISTFTAMTVKASVFLLFLLLGTAFHAILGSVCPDSGSVPARNAPPFGG